MWLIVASLLLPSILRPDVDNALSISSCALPAPRCANSYADIITADMHDGDQKTVALSDGILTITPYGNSQQWSTRTTFDSALCSALVNFTVPGKPNPPPLPLTARIVPRQDIVKYDPQKTRVAVEFYDFTGHGPS